MGIEISHTIGRNNGLNIWVIPYMTHSVLFLFWLTKKISTGFFYNGHVLTSGFFVGEPLLDAFSYWLADWASRVNTGTCISQPWQRERESQWTWKTPIQLCLHGKRLTGQQPCKHCCTAITLSTSIYTGSICRWSLMQISELSNLYLLHNQKHELYNKMYLLWVGVLFYHDVGEIFWPQPIRSLKLGHVTGQGSMSPTWVGRVSDPGKNGFHKKCKNLDNIALYLIASLKSKWKNKQIENMSSWVW